MIKCQNCPCEFKSKIGLGIHKGKCTNVGRNWKPIEADEASSSGKIINEKPSQKLKCQGNVAKDGPNQEDETSLESQLLKQKTRITELEDELQSKEAELSDERKIRIAATNDRQKISRQLALERRNSTDLKRQLDVIIKKVSKKFTRFFIKK